MDHLLVPYGMRRAFVAMDHLYGFITATESWADRAVIRAELASSCGLRRDYPELVNAIVAFLDKLDAEDKEP